MKKSFLVSLSALLVLVLWMLSGQLSATRPDNTEETVTPEKESEDRVMSVRVQNPQSKLVIREVILQGQIEPYQSVQVAAETTGLVTRMVAKKGQRVKQGQLLLELSMDDRGARQREAQALLKLRETEHAGVIKLQQSGLQSKTELAVAEAQLEAAKAVLEQIELDIKHTQIRAPFDGVINDHLVEPGDYMDRGNPAMLLVDDSRLLAVGNVPQQSIQSVKQGLAARVKLLNGKTLQGEISFVSATADAATRSFRTEVEIDNSQHQIAAGISGEIRIPVGETPGHFLSPAMLALDDSGELGVKAVDVSNHVVFHSVTILKTTPEGAWVTGLPDNVQVITLGQGFVRSGDKIKAVPEKSLTESGQAG